MRKILSAFMLTVALSGCAAANLANKPVDLVTLQKSAYAARATYVGLLEGAVIITDTPRCERAPPPCVRQAVVNQIRAVMKTAGDATKTAEAMAQDLKADPTVLALTVNTATQATAVFQRAVDDNKGGK